MRTRIALLGLSVSTAVLTIVFAAPSSLAADKAQSFTGKVSDAMCGAEHMEPGVVPAECTRDCVAKGSKYALVVGEKVYTLDGEDKTALTLLDKMADQKVRVTGIANGDTIQVQSVTPAK